MGDEEIKIDESTHERVPTTVERITHALFSVFFGFILVNIIAFWMFPGPGLGGIYLVSNAHPMGSVVGEMTTVFIYTFLLLCAVLGWFQGKYFTDRLKGYISWWKFW